LAERSGVSRAAIRAIEDGGNQPTVKTLARLAAGAGCRLRLGVEWPDGRVYLLDGTDHDELGRWAAVQRPAGASQRTCRPERVLGYLDGRPGATADQVAYALGVSEYRVVAMLRLLCAVDLVAVAVGRSGARRYSTVDDGAGPGSADGPAPAAGVG
jgi:transcriptional regulator with XRE-family HTH domain